MTLRSSTKRAKLAENAEPEEQDQAEEPNEGRGEPQLMAEPGARPEDPMRMNTSGKQERQS